MRKLRTGCRDMILAASGWVHMLGGEPHTIIMPNPEFSIPSFDRLGEPQDFVIEEICHSLDCGTLTDQDDEVWMK